MTSPIAQLQELFPNVTDAQLQSALREANGDLQHAVAALLATSDLARRERKPPEQKVVSLRPTRSRSAEPAQRLWERQDYCCLKIAPRAAGIEAVSVEQRSKTRLQSRVGRAGTQKGAGWHAFTDHHQGAKHSAPVLTPEFRSSQKSEAQLPSDAFPALGTPDGSHTHSPARSSRTISLASSKTGTPASRSPWATPSGAASPSPLESCPQQPAAVLAAELERRLAVQAEQPAYSQVVGHDNAHRQSSSRGQSWTSGLCEGTAVQDAALASLCESFPHADVELIKEVLVASAGSEEVARMLLAGMMTPHASPATSPHRARQGPQLQTQHLSAVKPGEGSTHNRNQQPPGILSDSDLKREQAVPYSNASQPRTQQSSSRGPASSKSSKSGQAVKRSSRQRRKQPAADHLETGALTSPETSDEEALAGSLDFGADQNLSQDIYHHHRMEALRLDRRRFRRLKHAAQLYAAGEHLQARLAVQEARDIKTEAEAAHREAAAQIELHNNRGKGVWELDLHGLHTLEAAESLDRRLSSLEGQHLAHSDRRTLRVIVGRGSHSSGGEAVLLRSAQNHLLKRQYAFEQRGGTLLVHPKRI